MPIKALEGLHTWIDSAAKRLFDVILSVAILLLAAPILMIVAIAVAITSPGPLLYKQNRVGIHGKLFLIYKFRTMCTGADLLGPSVTASNDNRITPIGKFLRTSKLDEFPQLINVMLGQMSLVGPRPQVARFVEKFDPEMRDIVLSVRPGVTGLTAICFRNEEQMLADVLDRERFYFERIMPVKLELDAWYVENRSIFKDCYIFVGTAWLLMVGAVRGMFARSEIAKDQALVKNIIVRYLSFSPPPSDSDRFHPAWFTRTHEMFFMREDDRVGVEA